MRRRDRYTAKMTAVATTSAPSATHACAETSGKAPHTASAATSPSSRIFTVCPASPAPGGGDRRAAARDGRRDAGRGGVTSAPVDCWVAIATC
jgi:hypothetical protein